MWFAKKLLGSRPKIILNVKKDLLNKNLKLLCLLPEQSSISRPCAVWLFLILRLLQRQGDYRAVKDRIAA